MHGEEEANKAKEASRALFSGSGSLENMPTVSISEENFVEGKMDIMSVLVAANLAESRSDARRAVQQGGVLVNNEKVTDIMTSFTPEQFGGDGLIVKRGKKKFAKITM